MISLFLALERLWLLLLEMLMLRLRLIERLRERLTEL